MTLEHVALNVPDPAASADWFVAQLGWRLLRRNDAAPFENFVACDGGRVIELYCNPLGELPDYPAMSPYTLHLALLVDDMDGERSRLLSAGASAVGEVVTKPSGDRLAFLRDPWGVPLQLVQRSEPLL